MPPTRMKIRGAVVRRVLGFSSLPLIGALTPMLVLPLIARVGGGGAWVAVGTGQALGQASATVVMYGWSLVGQTRIATSKGRQERHRIYDQAWTSRLRVAAFAVPIAAMCSVGASPQGYRALACLCTVSTGMTGLSIAWYTVGMGSPTLLLRYEVLPRAFGTLASAIAILMSGAVWLYPVLLLAAQAFGLCRFNLRVSGTALPRRPEGLHGVLREMRADWQYAGATILGTIYASAPLPVATMLDSLTGAASLVTADKLYRYSLFAVMGLANGLQEWVLSQPDDPRRWQRERAAVWMHGGVALVIGVGLCSLGIPMSSILFGSSVRPGLDLLVIYSAAFLAISISTPIIRNSLIPRQHGHAVFFSTLVTAAAGLSLMVLLGMRAGVLGVAMGFAASEVLNATIIAIILVRKCGVNCIIGWRTD